jgi:hypothetical protein
VPPTYTPYMQSESISFTIADTTYAIYTLKTNKKLGIIVASIIIAVILAFGAFKEQTNLHAFEYAEQITFGGSNAEEARAVAIWGTSKVIV